MNKKINSLLLIFSVSTLQAIKVNNIEFSETMQNIIDITSKLGEESFSQDDSLPMSMALAQLPIKMLDELSQNGSNSSNYSNATNASNKTNVTNTTNATYVKDEYTNALDVIGNEANATTNVSINATKQNKS